MISIYTILYIGTCDMGIHNVIQYSIVFFKFLGAERSSTIIVQSCDSLPMVIMETC